MFYSHQDAKSFLDYVYEQIKHGDDDHREWLRTKLDELIPELTNRIDKIKKDHYDP